MTRIIFVSVVLLVLSGCVSTEIIPLSQSDMNNLQGKTMTTVTRNKPDFAAFTAGKATFGALGAGASIGAGNQLIQENDVDDPANYIADALLEELKQRHNVKSILSQQTIAKSEDVAELSRQYGEADMLLDVRTINWSYTYFPTNWTHYRIIYSVKLRLIDTKTSKAIAEGFCARVPEGTENAPTHEELLANNAQRLKDELRIAADHCIHELKSNTLKL